MNVFDGLAERRKRGETIIDKNGFEVVAGRVLAAEYLAEYYALIAESDEVWKTVSPFRSDYDVINASIDMDLLSKAQELAVAVEDWLEQEPRDKINS